MDFWNNLKSGSPDAGFSTYFQKYGGPNVWFVWQFQKYEVQIVDFYTNPRLGPNYGSWNDIFTLTKSFPKDQNYKGDADTHTSRDIKLGCPWGVAAPRPRIRGGCVLWASCNSVGAAPKTLASWGLRPQTPVLRCCASKALQFLLLGF